ncbi:MAG: hypothetical protein EAZ42_09755 [Verrucomicrobia bacterium]|nr:MAG: hypothetical protein EAZ42_09755 [Verrucomicrobiota bacterium]
MPGFKINRSRSPQSNPLPDRFSQTHTLDYEVACHLRPPLRTVSPKNPQRNAPASPHQTFSAFSHCIRYSFIGRREPQCKVNENQYHLNLILWIHESVQ